MRAVQEVGSLTRILIVAGCLANAVNLTMAGHSFAAILFGLLAPGWSLYRGATDDDLAWLAALTLACIMLGW